MRDGDLDAANRLQAQAAELAARRDGLAAQIATAARERGDREPAPPVPAGKRPGLKFAFFRPTAIASLDDIRRLEPAETGVAASISPPAGIGPVPFALAFAGSIEIPADGTYVFIANCDDGVRLWIDGRMVIDDNTHHGAEDRHSKPLQLTRGPHRIELHHMNGGGPFALRLDWRGPGFERTEVPAEALSHNPQRLLTRTWSGPTGPRRSDHRISLTGVAPSHPSGSHPAPVRAAGSDIP